MTDAVVPESRWANYQKWSANSVLTLCNVPWNNDYRDLAGFDAQTDLDAYIDSKQTAQITKFSLAKFNRNVQIDTPFNAAMQYNYLRVQNPLMPIDGDVQRNYYYFINGVDYVGPRNTLLTLQLDVWATFGFDVTFGRCYVEQGHIGIANENQFQQYGRSYLTVPEGLDTGNEYRVVHTETELFDDGSSGGPASSATLNVLICSTVDLTQDPGTVTDPALNSAPGGLFNGMPSAAAFYVFETGNDFLAFMAAYADKPWITQAIISVTVLPLTRYYSVDFSTAANVSPVAGVKFYHAPVNTMTEHQVNTLTAWRDATFIADILGTDYAMLKKFLTSPYMAIELTTWTGSPLLIKPENWQDPDGKVAELAAFVPPGQRIAIMPYRYNGDAESTIGSGTPNDDGAAFLDFAAVISNFPTLPLVNNMALEYLAANRNGIAFSFQNAGWQQQRAISGAQAAANVANSQIGNTQRQAGIGIGATNQQATLQNNLLAAQGIVGVLSSATQGNAAGMVEKTAGAFINQQSVMQGADIQTGARGASAASDVQTAGQIRDTNQGFANYAAQGDYRNEVAGIQAKIQDAQLTQPSVSGQFGGDAFNLVNTAFGYSLRWMMPNLSALRQIGNYWLRYGYAIHQYLTPPANMRCMSKFTYWKMSETYISQAPIPEGFKQIIRGIFEKGVTVWSNPDDIPTAALTDNTPLGGISY